MNLDILNIYSTLNSPVLTSKSYKTLEDNNVYCFFVNIKSTKHTVALAVEKIFGVKVKRVQIINVKGKRKSYRQVLGKRSNKKKAIVTLTKDNKIESIKKE